MSIKYMVNTDKLNVRSGPGTDHSVVDTISRGTLVEFDVKNGSFVRIGDGRWCSINYLLKLSEDNGSIAPSVKTSESGRPIFFMQSDKRWALVPYTAVNDIRQTIKSSGCGPTCAAMLINEFVDKTYSPVDCCKWAAANGYRTANNGTAWGMFKALAVKYGFKYLQTSSFTTAKEFMDENPNANIVCVMSKGNWTSGGHYILCYDMDDTYVYINDPASTKAARLKNTQKLLASQCRQYFCFSYGSEATTWLDKSKIEKITPKKLAVVASRLNIRDTYSTSGRVIGQFYGGTLVTASKKCGDWYYVASTDNKTCGWCSATYLKNATVNNINSVIATNTKNAIKYLTSIKFLDAPEWWEDNAYQFDNVTHLLIKISNRIKLQTLKINTKSYSFNTAGLYSAINHLHSHDVIDSPEYWEKACITDGKLNNMGYLMVKAANYIRK